MRLLCKYLLILFLFSCTEKKTAELPKNLIPKIELVSLLIDLEIMESYYEQFHKRPNIYKTTLDSASRQLMADRQISEDQLKATINYYSSMPDSLFMIYEMTLDSINSLVIKNKKVTEEL